MPTFDQGPGRPLAVTTAVVVVLTGWAASTGLAQRSDVHDDGSAHYHGLHFSHPLFTESIRPDTKVRFNAGGEWEDGGRAAELEVEAEYAFDRSFSIEIGVPYVRLEPNGAASTSALDNIEVAFKFANFAFEDAGVLLGYGFAVGLPTGDPAKGIGSDSEWELAPFLNAGFKRGVFELIGWAIFGVPLNLPEGEEVENDVHYDISGLVHVAPWLQGLLEVNGAVALNGEQAGAGVVSLSPGIKVAPFGPRLFVGLGGSFPLGDTDLKARALVSLFYHF